MVVGLPLALVLVFPCFRFVALMRSVCECKLEKCNCEQTVVYQQQRLSFVFSPELSHAIDTHSLSAGLPSNIKWQAAKGKNCRQVLKSASRSLKFLVDLIVWLALQLVDLQIPGGTLFVRFGGATVRGGETDSSHDFEHAARLLRS